MIDYHEYCRTLNERDALMLEEFSNTELSITHYIDIQNCFIENIFNPNHVLDYFTHFNDLTCFELCKKAIELVKDE